MNPADAAFLNFVEELQARQPSLDWDGLLQPQGPEGIAILVVDLVRGFCDQGPLASPRINGLLEPVAEFLTQAHDRGVRKIHVACDCHPSDSPEFRAFPPHCIEGTSEAELAPVLAQLPFAGTFHQFPKRTLSSWVGTDLEGRLLADNSLRTLIVVGDCTDLCVHQAALGAQLLINQHHLPWQVVVISSLVDTYDLPLEVAQQIGALPTREIYSTEFLLHMQLNGVKVVREIL